MICSWGRFVVKFGGSSVRDNFAEAVSFVQRLWDGNDVAVVVSALKGTTDALLEVALGHISGYELLELHRAAAVRGGIDPSVLSPVFKELKEVFPLRESFPSTEAFIDHVLSFGELLSGILFVEALRRRGIPSVLFEPWNVIKTDGRFGNAEIDFSESAKAVGDVRDALEDGVVPVIPGFVGGFGEFRTTLGRGGSDYTASALGGLLDATGVFIMSDVDGIYTADPRRVILAKLIPSVSRKEASLAAKLGMKALHPKAVDASGGKPIYLGRTRDWHIGTLVGEKSSGMPIVTHRIEGERGIVSVVGVDSLPGFDFEYGEENGVPWVSVTVPRLRVGSTLNSIHWEVVGNRLVPPGTLSSVRVEALAST